MPVNEQEMFIRNRLKNKPLIHNDDSEKVQVKEQEMISRNRMMKKSATYKDVSTTWGKPKQKNAAQEPTNKVQKKNRDNRRSKPEEGKKPHCWHYVRGHCKRGKYCKFTHDSKHSYPDSHKVFLGGLPFQISGTTLCQHLKDMGFNVVNKPKVYGGFSPQVCLASENEAKSLIELGSITLEGVKVDVRSYQSFTKKNQDKLVDMSRRSVFLGGLRKGTTTQIIKKEFEAIGMKVVNYPLTKAGFCPQVTMATEEQAQKLVKMLKVEVNGALVDVRPYVGAGGLS